MLGHTLAGERPKTKSGMSRAAYLATWRQKNPGKHKAHQRAKRAARKGVSHAKYLAEWRRNNRSKYTEHKKRQHAKMKAADRDANPKEVKKKKSKLETEYAEDTMACIQTGGRLIL